MSIVGPGPDSRHSAEGRQAAEGSAHHQRDRRRIHREGNLVCRFRSLSSTSIQRAATRHCGVIPGSPCAASPPSDIRTRAPRFLRPSFGGILPHVGRRSVSSALARPGATSRFSRTRAGLSPVVSAGVTSSGPRTACGSDSMSPRGPSNTSSTLWPATSGERRVLRS